MRDRLIELITESDILCHTCGENSSSYCAEAIADLIITDGRIRPPCKVGDKVYWFKLNDEFVEAEIERCYFSAKTENGKEYFVPFTSLGKTVFLTREEAEAKQKEGEGGWLKILVTLARQTRSATTTSTVLRIATITFPQMLLK